MSRIQLRARPREHALYSDCSLLVTNLDGVVTGEGIEGFYFENARLLSRLELKTHSLPLAWITASPVDEDSLLAYGRVPTDEKSPLPGVDVEAAHFVGDGMRLELRIRNYSKHATARFDLGVHLAADFADIRERETPGAPRQQDAETRSAWDDARQEVVFRYCHPEIDRAVAVRVDRAPRSATFEDGALHVPVEAPPDWVEELHLSVEPIVDGTRHISPRRTFGEAASPTARVRERLRAEIPGLRTTNATVARAWQTATDDLASLPLGREPGPAAPSAGMPLYQQIFARDMLTIGWQALLAMPTMLRDALCLSAARQGTRVDDWYDEEPGKILDQARRGPLALLGLNPFLRYYGDVASPPDFLVMLGQYVAWTNDLDTARDLLPAARRAIGWLDQHGDLDGDGFIEYVTRSSEGVKNQGWKDGTDAIVDADGRIVQNPIAVSEVQAYWYAGLQQAALAFFFTGHRVYALELLWKAIKLKRRFDRVFWMEDQHFHAMALDAEKRQVGSIASHAGQILATGIVPREKGSQVAARLMEPDMFSGWGIRTLSSDHIAYDPLSYHRGCVWPVEAGTTAFGFARYGCLDELDRLTEGLFASSDLFVANRLPETLGGFERGVQHPHPGVFPGSCDLQGWSASAVVLAIQALLGMRAVAPLRLLLIDPHLPPWLPDLRLEGVRVGEARVDLELYRTKKGTTRYRVTRKVGRVSVLRQPVPQGRYATILGRICAALVSVFSA